MSADAPPSARRSDRYRDLVMFGAGSVVAALRLGGAAAAFAFDAVARPRVFELELAQGTQGVIEGGRDEPVQPPAAPTTT